MSKQNTLIRGAGILSGCLVLVACAPTNIQLAQEQERAGNYQAMLTYCKQAAQEPNPDPWAFLCQGDANMRLGDRQAAEAAYLTYLDRVPNDVDARLKLIEIYMADGRLAAAQQHVEEVLKFDPASYKAYYFLGEINRINLVCGAAVNAYLRAIEINPAFYAAKAGLEKTEKEVCKGKYKAPSKQEQRSEPPVKKEKVFQGGGKAIKEGQW